MKHNIVKHENHANTGLTYEVIGALADALGRAPLTIERMIERNDIRLTSAKALEVLERFQVKLPEAAQPEPVK